MVEISLLYPGTQPPAYQDLPEATVHDLGLEEVCEQLTSAAAERNIILRTMTKLPSDPEVIRYRCEVFEDVLRFPKMRETMMTLLDRVDFLRTYGSFAKDTDASGVWELVHRLDEMDEYIACVQSTYECLNGIDLQSDGLRSLREYARSIYEDQGFMELKKDIAALKKETDKVKSVTLGVNLNERYEPVGVGIVSVNSKAFVKSGVVGNFCDFLSRGDHIREEADWDHNYTYHTAGNELAKTAEKASQAAMLRFRPGIVNLGEDNRGSDSIHALDRAMGAMISAVVKKLKSVLSRHVSVSMQSMTGLIPEFMYYIRWAEHIEKLQQKGYAFCKAQAADPQERMMDARGLYNLRLAQSMAADPAKRSDEMVLNDVCFDADHRIYILTGANRGGKTTVTQAIGLLFLLAQGGIRVPAASFRFSPLDNLFTHYPADENQTMDLGRLGEESSRFREIFLKLTSRSLLLLNESFSTTSFEEGYYIAKDVVRSLKRLGVRTIFNTHMHKLAADAEELNAADPGESLIASLVSETQSGRRSYRVKVAPPEGSSYAHDIALKYGVTFEQLEKDRAGK